MENPTDSTAMSKTSFFDGSEEEGNLPSRFVAMGGDDKNRVTVRDTETDRTVVISIHAWPFVRKALDELFG